MTRLLTKGFGILLTALMLSHCGSPPTSLPLTQFGSLRIVAMDTTTIRFIYLEMDDVVLGMFTNPCYLAPVLAGTHKIVISDGRGAIDAKMVDVSDGRQTNATVWLTGDGPYVGKKAPTFSATSIDGVVLELQKLRGCVVLLAFFEHT